MYNMQQKRTQADCSQLAAFNCKPRWPKRNGTWDATKRNGTEGGNARERGKGNVNWPPSWTTYMYIYECVCARMQNFIWQICVISPAVPAEGSICASSEISPAAELQVEQTIRSTPAKLAASWRCSRVHAKGLAAATAMVVAVALPIAAVVGVEVEVGLCLSNLMSK